MNNENRQASKEVTKYINSVPSFAKPICEKLRTVILNASPDIEECWNWRPQYFSGGLICGFGGYENFVKLTFYNGAAMTDDQHLFNQPVQNEFSRSIHFTGTKQVNENFITSYICESILINNNSSSCAAGVTSVTPLQSDVLIPKTRKTTVVVNDLAAGYDNTLHAYLNSSKPVETKKESIQKLVNMHGIRISD